MDRVFVNTPSMKTVGWENEVLEIEFKDGTTKRFRGVTFVEYCAFMSRASLGSSLVEIMKKHAAEDV